MSDLLSDLIYVVRVRWSTADGKIDSARRCKAWPFEAFTEAEWDQCDAYEWAELHLPSLKSKICRWWVAEVYPVNNLASVEGKEFDLAPVMSGISGGMKAGPETKGIEVSNG